MDGSESGAIDSDSHVRHWQWWQKAPSTIAVSLDNKDEVDDNMGRRP